MNYYTYGEQHTWFKENVLVYQNALSVLQKRNALSLSASIKPMANNGVPCPPETVPDPTGGCMRVGKIDGVTITVPAPADSALTGPDGGPGPSSGGGSGGYGCEYYNSCYPTPPIPPKPSQEDLCATMKAQKETEAFKKNMTDLKGKTGLKKETGYTQNGSTGDWDYQENASATETANSLRLPDAKQYNIKSYSHTHVDDYKYTDSDGNEIIRTGIKMFSPADVSYLMDMLQNAKDRGINFSDVSGTMVTSLGTYTLRFSGSEYQLKTFTDDQVSNYREPYKTFMTDNSNLSLEQKFLQFIDTKMNVKGVQLFKLNDDGTTTKTELNSDKTSVTTSNCP